MIKLQDMTPEVYYKQSRDFQYIGRLYDLVLNSVKTNTDMIYDIPSSDAAGSKMVDLLTLTLGFKSKHNYNIKQLQSVCSVFMKILKNKGSFEAINIAANAVLNAEGIDRPCTLTFDQENYDLQIFIDARLTDLNLLRDLLIYILPAGISCSIIRSTTAEQLIKTTDLPFADKVLSPMIFGNTPSGQLPNHNESLLARPEEIIDTVNDRDNSNNFVSGFNTSNTVFKPDNNNNNN